MDTKTRARARLIGISAALTLTLTSVGCTSDGTSQSTGGAATQGAGGLTQITLAANPTIDLAPLQLAQDLGFFAEEGLEIKVQPAPGSAATVPSVISGDMPIAYIAVSSTLFAVAQGLPLATIAPGGFSVGEEGDISAIYVAADSTITSLEGLRGKRMGVPALRSWGETATQASLAASGVDPTAVQFVEAPFAEAGAMLSGGQVDAVEVVEPFTTILKRQGAKLINKPFTDIGEGAPLQSTEYITSEDYLAKNPTVIEGFRRALTKGIEHATEHPDEARQAIRKILPQLNEDVAKDLTLPVWLPEVNRASYERIVGMLKKYGGLTTDPDLNKLLGHLE